MKKSFILAAFVLAALCSPALKAQGKHEIDAFLGGFKAEFNKMEDGRNYNDLLFDSDEIRYSGDLFDLYEPHYSVKSSPVFTLTYHYSLNDWIRVGAQANYSTLKGKYWYKLGNRPSVTFDEASFSVLPSVKVRIPSFKHFRLYGKVAAGVQMNFGSRIPDASPVEFAWDIVPIGAEWGGQRIFGTAEFCYGSVIRGGRIGLGFRF